MAHTLGASIVRAFTAYQTEGLPPLTVWTNSRWDMLESGVHGIVWGGVDARGATASPGVYFVRLTSGAQGRVVKLVLLR